MPFYICSKLFHHAHNFEYTLQWAVHNPNLLPHYLQKKSEIHTYNTRHCSSLHPAIGKSEATYRTFSYHAILIWNYLSKLICTNVTLACFKKRSLVYLQTHLISYRTVR